MQIKGKRIKLSNQEVQVIQTLISSIFRSTKRNEFGEQMPFIPTRGQCEMFAGVTNPAFDFVWISAPTRYGKSDVLGMASLFLAKFLHLKVVIVAGSSKKAEKIMEYVIAHLGDHEELHKGLLNVKDMSNIDKLKIQANKEALKWNDGGWIYITSIDARNKSSEGEGVVGEGGDVVILEEAGLIREKDQVSKVIRMPEKDRGWGKLVMSGNCIENSVFEDAFNDEDYFKVLIDLEQAIKEGRKDPEQLEKQKTKTTAKDWKRYYLVQFPAANEFTYFKPQKYDSLPPIEKLKIYGAIDPALGKKGKDKNKPDKNKSLVGIVVIGKDENGKFYELENIGEQIRPNEAIDRIFSLPYKFERFYVEAVQFQAYFMEVMNEKSMQKELYIPFEGVQQKKSKEVRIEGFEPAVNTGQILFSGRGELWNEMQDYPEADHLDVLDVCEMCFRAASGGGFEVFFG